MDSAARAALDAPVADLQRIFGSRLEAMVAYGRSSDRWARSLALVASLTMDDLVALAVAAPAWHARGIATPLVMPRREFASSLDAFPLEYGDIIDTHAVLFGDDPFEGVCITPQDARRGIESHAASHLLHLRENFVELQGRPLAVGALVRDSAPAFHALLRRMARLDGASTEPPVAVAQWAAARVGLDPRVVGDILALATEPAPGVDATRLFPGYLAAVEALLHAIDQWPVS